MTDTIIFRLRTRAAIRRQITSRKSVQEGKPDRIADLLEEAANEIEILRKQRPINRFIQIIMNLYDRICTNPNQKT
jgi:hypothetical protein